MNLVFVGFKHRHTGEIYKAAMANPKINVLGAFEDTETGRALADGLGMDFNYKTLDDVLSDPNVDAISLGGYYGERGAQAIAALKAGKHVYGDKPICTRLSEIDEIEKLSKEKGLKVGCYLGTRFSHGIKAIREIILSGKLGEVGTCQFFGQHPLQYGVRPMWYFEEGKHGGTINDIAIHGVDAIRFVTGLGLKNATAARTWNHFATEVKSFHDCAQFMVELENGAGMMADISYAAPASCGFGLETYWRITIWGTKGVIEYKMNGNSHQDKLDSSTNAIVQVAFEGDSGFHIIENEKYETTPLDEFLKDINGEESLLTTEDVIRTSRDVLTIQAAANK